MWNLVAQFLRIVIKNHKGGVPYFHGIIRLNGSGTTEVIGYFLEQSLQFSKSDVYGRIEKMAMVTTGMRQYR
jgi:redox-regulated HSP33 family molecular chaperone